jgi:prefoldin subunit 5
MATKKKSTVQDLKKSINELTKPKLKVLTDEQIQQLRDLAVDVTNIRRTLEDLEGEDDISKIMFKVGAMFTVAEQAEESIDSLLEDFPDEDDSWGDDF